MKTLKLLFTVLVVLLLTYFNAYPQAYRECGTIVIDDYDTPYFGETVSGYADYSITWKEHFVRGSEMTGYSIKFKIVLTGDESENTYIISGTSTEKEVRSNGAYNETGVCTLFVNDNKPLTSYGINMANRATSFFKYKDIDSEVFLVVYDLLVEIFK